VGFQKKGLFLAANEYISINLFGPNYYEIKNITSTLFDD